MKKERIDGHIYSNQSFQISSKCCRAGNYEACRQRVLLKLQERKWNNSSNVRNDGLLLILYVVKSGMRSPD